MDKVKSYVECPDIKGTSVIIDLSKVSFMTMESIDALRLTIWFVGDSKPFVRTMDEIDVNKIYEAYKDYLILMGKLRL